MSEPTGLAAIGIDFKALLFQVVNFAILVLLLRYFAYRPVVRLLEARRLKIEESLATAERLVSEKACLHEERQQTLAAAEREAQALVSQGKKQAASIIEAAQTKAQAEAERLRQQTEAQLQQEQAALVAAIKGETLTLVKRATEKIIDQKLDDQSDANLIERALAEVESTS